jgi:hypothetical protein
MAPPWLADYAPWLNGGNTGGLPSLAGKKFQEMASDLERNYGRRQI